MFNFKVQFDFGLAQYFFIRDQIDLIYMIKYLNISFVVIFGIMSSSSSSSDHRKLVETFERLFNFIDSHRWFIFLHHLKNQNKIVSIKNLHSTSWKPWNRFETTNKLLAFSQEIHKLCLLSSLLGRESCWGKNLNVELFSKILKTV